MLKEIYIKIATKVYDRNGRCDIKYNRSHSAYI